MFNRHLWNFGWDDRNMPAEDRAEKDRWHWLCLAIDRAIPAGSPKPPYERLSDEQVFTVARKHGVDPAEFGFDVL
jgi:hypothetical protein